MTPGDLHIKISHSVKTLQTRATAVAQEHRERIKRLKDVQDKIEHDSISGQLGFGDITMGIAPEIMALIDNPTYGL
jgi:hypothetical protein